MASPATALPLVRSLGTRIVRVSLPWYSLAPHPTSTRKPNFDASNPNAYPAVNWAPYDAFVRTAAGQGLTVSLAAHRRRAPLGGRQESAAGPTVKAADAGWRPERHSCTASSYTP